MNKLLGFLKKSGVVFLAIAFIMLWISFIRKGMPFLVQFNPFDGSYYYTHLGAIILGCVLAPLWEELIFRHVPLQITKRINEYTKQDYTWYAILLSSYIFGVGHNNGWYGIVLQSIGGVILCFVYLKNNYSYWSSVVVHMGWNFGVMFLIPFIENLVD